MKFLFGCFSILLFVAIIAGFPILGTYLWGGYGLVGGLVIDLALFGGLQQAAEG